MKFITGVRIKNFRSLGNVDLRDLGAVTPVVGINGSGKSNILRALNVLFNREVDLGVPPDMARDFYDPSGRSRKRKQFSIEADLDFGPDLKKPLRALVRQVGGRGERVTIRRSYSLVAPKSPLLVDALFVGADRSSLREVKDRDEHRVVERLLDAIRFRYISNDVSPVDFLMREEAVIREAVLQRMKRSSRLQWEDQIALISKAADGLVRPVKKGLVTSTGRISDMAFRTPVQMKDISWTGEVLVAHGDAARRGAGAHGSGIQALLSYFLLMELDTSLGETFGHRRGAVWAIEEPESFLHSDLRATLAEQFRTWADEPRLQILFTTHSSSFLGAGESGVIVDIAQRGASSTRTVAASNLHAATSQAGAIRFAHPLNSGALKPMLIVEGKTDRILLKRAYEEAARVCPYEIVCLEDLDRNIPGGMNAIRAVLSSSRSAIHARPPGSPIVVLLDHEAKDKLVADIQAILELHPGSVCLRMPPERCVDDVLQVDKTGAVRPIDGIEAYLSRAFFEDAANETRPRGTFQVGGGGELLVPASWIKHTRVKPKLHELLASRSNPADTAALVTILEFVEEPLVQSSR